MRNFGDLNNCNKFIWLKHDKFEEDKYNHLKVLISNYSAMRRSRTINHRFCLILYRHFISGSDEITRGWHDLVQSLCHVKIILSENELKVVILVLCLSMSLNYRLRVISIALKLDHVQCIKLGIPHRIRKIL